MLEQATSAELDALRRRLDRHAHGHIRQALRLKWFDDAATTITTIGGIVVLSLSALLLGIAAPPLWIAISLTATSGAITLVGVIQSVWKPGERYQRHKIWSSKFSALENDTRMILCGQGSKTFEDIISEVNFISEDVDLVPENVWRNGRSKEGAPPDA